MKRLNFYSGDHRSKISQKTWISIVFDAKSKSYHFQDMSSSFIATLFFTACPDLRSVDFHSRLIFRRLGT